MAISNKALLYWRIPRTFDCNFRSMRFSGFVVAQIPEMKPMRNAIDEEGLVLEARED